MGSNGGYIGYDATPKGDGKAPGVWGMRDIYLARRRSTWPTQDPYFSNVVALLHFDGADASTTFTDVKGHTFTASGNAQIDTAQSLFGGASGVFDGSGDYLSTPDSADWDFGTGDFTVELAIRFASLPVNAVMTMISTYDGSASGWSIQYRTDAGAGNRLTFGVGDAGNNFAWSPSTNTWYSVAVSRSGTSLRAFIDGTQIGSTITNSSNLTNSAALWIGALNFGGPIQGFNGWLDELRITKGVARHTANYTVAAEPFPRPMSIATHPIGYPVGEVTLATWFPKLDFLLAPGFAGAEVAVGFTRELAWPATASILLYPDSQNAYTGFSYEIEVSWVGSLVDYLVLSYSTETAYSYAATPVEYNVVGYSTELDYTQFANIKIKDPSVNFSYSVNYGLPHNVHSLAERNRFTRTLEFDASKRAVDFTNDIRRHISYIVNG